MFEFVNVLSWWPKEPFPNDKCKVLFSNTSDINFFTKRSNFKMPYALTPGFTMIVFSRNVGLLSTKYQSSVSLSRFHAWFYTTFTFILHGNFLQRLQSVFPHVTRTYFIFCYRYQFSFLIIFLSTEPLNSTSADFGCAVRQPCYRFRRRRRQTSVCVLQRWAWRNRVGNVV